MADRFWVGGGSANTWAATGNTNWAATSGGANNASVPTTTDRAIFDGNSGSGNSVIGANITVQALVCTGYVGTITHNTSVTLTINTASVDSLLLSAGMTYTPATASATIAFTNTSGNADVTSAGKRLAAMTINAVGGTVRLLDALRVDTSSTSTLTLTAGTFNGNAQAVTCNIFSSSNSNTRVLQLGDGLWTVGTAATNGTTIWSMATTTGLTFTKGASNIVVPTNGVGGNRIFAGGGLTYNTVTVDLNSSRAMFFISGANTFGALSVGAGNAIVFPNATTVISTAPTWVGTAALPILVECAAPGNPATISVPGGMVSLSYGGVRDITAIGGASFVADNAYDFGSNSGWAIAPPSVAPSAAAVAAAVWDELLAGHAIAGSAGKSLSDTTTKTDELHKLDGLSIPNPMTVTPTLRTAGTISQTLTGDGVTTKTVTRTA